MSDFEARLRERVARNEQLAQERASAEQEMDRAVEAAEERRAQEERERRQRQDARHAELADRLAELVEKVRDLGSSVTVRAGWSASGEEYLARFATVDVRPQRALSVELDRDDDEVLVRWHSAVGESLELYHLLEFDTGMLEELVLQVIDDDLWSGRTVPPAFPGNPD
ncbi:MAG: hypothetical protein KY469_13190 [Actinobacteria bacterium]|nr:hypothetical protein [Actinomycetota bacterium]